MSELTVEQQSKINSLLSVVPQQVVIRNKQEYTDAASSLIVVSQNLKLLEDVRKSITGPMNTAITRINALFSGPKAKLEYAVSDLKAGMNNYLREERAKAEAAQRLVDEAARQEQARIAELAAKAKQKADKELATLKEREAKALAAGSATRAAAAAEAASKVMVNQSIRADVANAKIASLNNVPSGITVPSTAGVTTAKKWVFEVEDINLVPRQFLMLAEPVVKAAISAGQRTIPGLKIKQEETVVISSRKVS